MSMNSRTRNVGMGSSDDDLTGDDMTSRRTSRSEPGHILTVQSTQFYAVQKAECAVQVAKLCSPKYVL